MLLFAGQNGTIWALIFLWAVKYLLPRSDSHNHHGQLCNFKQLLLSAKIKLFFGTQHLHQKQFPTFAFWHFWMFHVILRTSQILVNFSHPPKKCSGTSPCRLYIHPTVVMNIKAHVYETLQGLGHADWKCHSILNVHCCYIIPNWMLSSLRCETMRLRKKNQTYLWMLSLFYPHWVHTHSYTISRHPPLWSTFTQVLHLRSEWKIPEPSGPQVFIPVVTWPLFQG